MIMLTSCQGAADPAATSADPAVTSSASAVSSSADTSAVFPVSETAPQTTSAVTSSETAPQTTSTVTSSETAPQTTSAVTEAETAASAISAVPAADTVTAESTVSTAAETTAAVPKTTAEAVTKKPAAPSEPYIITPAASGKKTEATDLAVIDYSNASKGYVMCSYTGKKKKVKVQITAPNGVTYSYNLDSGGKYEVFPLSEGDGDYQIGVYENVSGSSYANAASITVSAALENSLLPFLTPNQYVNYSASSKAVALGSELCAGAETDMDKIDAVYSWIVDNVTYDKALAKDAPSGYLPNIDGTVSNKTGICLDYAGTACAMLRSQKIPTKLVVGYAGTTYHAWLSVYTKEQGWIYGIIYFDGTSWHRLDPTFAAGEKSSDRVMKFISDDANYTAKFIY